MMVSEPLHQEAYKTDAALRMLEILSPPAPERGKPFRPGVDPEARHFGFIAERPWETFAAVLVYNPQDEPADLDLDLPQLEAIGERYHAWSFWDHTYLGVVDRTFSVRDLAPHASKLLRLSTCAEEHRWPTLIGSDLHIAVGAAEIADIRRSPGTFTVALNDAGARSGSLWFYSQQPLALRAFEGMQAALLHARGDGLWELALAHRFRGAPQIVRLAMGSATAPGNDV